MLAGEFPASAMPELRDMGSFDCVIVRYANDNFAQDDRA